MGSGTAVRVRGIYTTALTALLVEGGFRVADPSPAIQQRFGFPPEPVPPEVRVTDQPDRQGILLVGPPEAVRAVERSLRRSLPLALFSARSGSGGVRICAVDFPSPVKAYLDRVRARYAPTLPGHHRLQVCGGPGLREAESTGDLRVMGTLERSLVWDRIRPGAPYRVHHRKPGGRTVVLRGTVEQAAVGAVTLRRAFRPGGTYDSLGTEKRAGDWGLVELVEGAWCVRRRYFREDGTELGEIYNVNTPVEIYPEFAAYVDLEVDVVRFPDGAVRVVDLEVLEGRVRRGELPGALAQVALWEADRIARWLLRQGPAWDDGGILGARPC